MKGLLVLALPPALLSGLFLLARELGYLWFHTLAELATIIIAFTAMVVATTSRQFTRNHFVIYIATALGWCAALDLAHTLVFKGMHLLATDDANPATQLWIGARFLQAIAVVTAPAFLRRSVHLGWLHAGFGAAAALIALSIASGAFPDAYVEGRGLTAFKIYSEYVIIALFAASLWRLQRNRDLMSRELRRNMTASIAVMIVSEFLFTQYASVYGGANLAGHIAKIFAYWFIFVALVQSTLQEPFGMLARAASSYDAVPDPAIIVQEDGRIRQANRVAARLAGKSVEELVGRSSHALFHDPAVSVAECPVCARLSPMAGISRIELRKEGGATTVECTLAPFPGDGPVAFVQVIRDVSERRRQEDELLFRTRRVEALLKLPEAAERLDETAFMQFGQELAEDLTGSGIAFIHLVNDDEQTIELVAWSRRTLDGYCRAKFDKHYPVQDAGIWADALRQRAPVVFNDYPAAPGRRGLPEGHAPLQRLISVPVLEDGKVRMLTGVGNKPVPYTDRDVETVQLFSDAIWRIVHRRRSERALRENEANLATLIGAIPDVVWMKNPAGAVALCNPAFRKLFGLGEDEAMGKTSRDIADAETAEVFDRQDRLAIAAGKSVTNEEWVTGADGRRALFETTKTPVKLPSGELLGVIGVSRDITERKRAEDELRRLAYERGERIKEMRCMAEITRLLERQGLDEAAILGGTVEILPSAFRFPERMQAAITSTWGHFGEHGKEAPGPSLERVLRVNGGRVGTLRVYYRDAAAIAGEPFLPEESNLLDSVATLLGRALERHNAARRVQRLTRLFEMLGAANRNIMHARSLGEVVDGLFQAVSGNSEFPTLFIASSETGAFPLQVSHSQRIDAEGQSWLGAILADPSDPYAPPMAEFRSPQIATGHVPANAPAGTWPGFLKSQGLKSYAMMPLLCEDRALGVAALYATTNIDFDEEYLGLLNQMTEDVAFALSRLASQERSANTEHRFREIFEASPVPMQLISLATGEMRAVNKALLDWLGYSREEIATQDAWFDRVYEPAEFRAQLREVWKRDIETARGTSSTRRSPAVMLRAKDGTARSAVGTVSILGDDAIVAWEDLATAGKPAR